MAGTPIRFDPLEGLPDADMRGAGTFTFDDGTTMVAEDPELASLVKSYQPPAMPDMRLAQNDAGVPDDPVTAVFGADPFGDQVGARQAADFLQATNAPREEPTRGEHAAPDASQIPLPSATPTTPVPPAMPTTLPAIPSGSQGAGTPGISEDSAKAAELHRIAADAALRGKYVPGQAAGYTPVQRSGALPEELAARQAQERQSADADYARSVEQSRAAQADLLEKSALQEAMRLTVQRETEARIQREAEQKKARLEQERRTINDAEIDTTFAQGDGFRQVMAVAGAALLGAIGSDAGLRMIEHNIDRHVRNQMQIRGSKLNALAEQIGSTEQVIAGAKAKIYELLEKQSAVTQKTLQAADIRNQTPAVLAEFKRKALENEQEYERQSLGKTVEKYQQARAGGFTGPNLDAAAKHYEAAAKNSEGPKPDAAKQQQQRALSQLRRLRDTLERGRKSGALQGVVGWQDKLGANSVQEFFGGMSPEQKEQATALEELQVNNLMALVREPNNMRTQNMVQSIGVPKNDRDIEGAINRLNQLIDIEEQGYQNGPQPVEVR